jgi:hypothetical protein
MKFLRIKDENTLSWKIHIDMTVPKLSAACFAVRKIKPFLSLETENDTLYIVSLHHELRNNFLGKFLM